MKRLVALSWVFALGCPRHEHVTETRTNASSAPSAPSAMAVAPPATSAAASTTPVSDPCAPDNETRARASLAEAAKAAAAKNWTASIKSYDDALSALGPCTGPLEARALGERGYVKLRAKDLDGARVDLTAARDGTADDDLLGAIHFNLALLADAKKKPDDGFTETALSLAFRPNDAVRSRLSRCGIAAVDGEQAGVRYATVAEACKALDKNCGTDAGVRSALRLCSGDATALPCVSEGKQTSDVPWPDEASPGIPVAAAAQPLSLVTQEGDALWVYPAGLRILNWRCGGADNAVVTTSGSVIVVTYTGSTGAFGGGPGLSCGRGYDVSSYAAISTKRHTTAASFSVVSRDGRLVCQH